MGLAIGSIFGIIGNLLGIGKTALDNRAKLKQLKVEQKFKIIEAKTEAAVGNIRNNNSADNSIDLITAENKKHTHKDEVVVYLFLAPLFVATVVPFIVAYKTNDWVRLNILFSESYASLSLLPEWYFVGLGFVLIDVLGFRSFARKLLDKWAEKIDLKKGLLKK
jgi:hypothetical protein